VGGPGANDPVAATTRGTGELIAAAIAAGAREVVVGVGGSATTDGGLGAVEGLGGVPFADEGVVVRVAYDVRAHFVDAARIFAPQKGANASQVSTLTKRLEVIGENYLERYGVDVFGLPGGGAAGGLGGGLAALGAELVPGFDLVASSRNLGAALAEADAVVTGEGRIDRTSFDGKVVGGVIERARQRALPVAAIVGSSALGTETRFVLVSLTEVFGEALAWSRTSALVADATERWLVTLAKTVA
jgi:glycerate kinase